MTGFTHGSIETGILGSCSTNVAVKSLQKQSTTAEIHARKGTVLPDISLVQSFYNQSPKAP